MCTIYPSAITQLSGTRGRMVAAALEIDGRADKAADAVYFQSELIYAGGAPYSPQAKAHAALMLDIEESITARGLAATIEFIRGE